MKIARIVCASALVACSALALAHTHLVKAVPADGSTVMVSPPEFVLTFAEPAKPLRFRCRKTRSRRRK
jgi:methionine-rich copper-binding protein CopC